MEALTAPYFVLPTQPSELELALWLAERTPAGAATVVMRPPGARAALHLPRLRQARPSPTPRLGRRRRGSAPAVHAAYLADVQGLSPRQLAASGLFGFKSERAARQHIRDGRMTAADLGAWPWAVVDGKPLPRNWWADKDFALALQDWAGELPAAPIVRRLRPRRYTAAARLLA